MKFNLDLSKLKEQIKTSETKKSFEKDPRYWKPTTDQQGNGMALIRFLPDAEGECWAKIFTHNFNYMVDNQKKWWIRNCSSTLIGYPEDGSGCPVCKKNSELWGSAFQEDKDTASERKRKLQFTSNILVIQDKANPENEGKIFLYTFGQKIFEKIKKRISPTDQDLEDPDFQEFNPYHPLEGATFKLKIKRQGEYPNYDDSEFSNPKALYDGDEKKITKVLTGTHLLSEFLAEDKFPTNTEVIQKLGPILGISKKPMLNEVQDTIGSDDLLDDISSTPTNDIPFDIDTDSDSDLDGDLAYFAKLK